MGVSIQGELFDKPEQNAGGGFEGADRLGRQLALWSAPLVTADASLLPDKDTIDGRVLDQQRNDAYIHGAIQHSKDSIVGSFYRLNLQPNHKYLGLDEVWAEEFQQAVESEFHLAAESDDNWFDAAGKLSFSDIIRLNLGVAMMSGESLATVEWLQDRMRPFRTAIQTIDPIRLANPNGADETSGWRKGVRVNSRGRALQFGIRTAKPNMPSDHMESYEIRVVNARKPWGRKQVLHTFEPFRVDQSRGVSELVSILKQSRMLGKFQDVSLQKAVLGASFAAAIESDLTSSEAFESIGGNSAKSMNDWAANYLAAIQAYTGESSSMHLDGVKIPHFYPGTKLKLLNAGVPEGVGTDFEKSMMRYLAAAFGYSYEEFAHDFTQTNYSSARAAMGETNKRMTARKKVSADKKASAILKLWFEERLNAGAFDDVLPRNRPNFYEGLNAEAYLNSKWIGAPKGQIDELKETEAAIARVENNMSTLEIECARLGSDFREIFAQRAREKKLQTTLEIVPVKQQPQDKAEPKKDDDDQDKERNDDDSND